MTEKQPLAPNEATTKLLGQFDRENSPTTLDNLVATGITLDEAACWITDMVATGFCSELSRRGQETEYLARWHSSVRADCSDRFTMLKEQNPALRREDINHIRELQLLNGIRRGVHRAMVRTQKLPKGLLKLNVGSYPWNTYSTEIDDLLERTEEDE